MSPPRTLGSLTSRRLFRVRHNARHAPVTSAAVLGSSEKRPSVASAAGCTSILTVEHSDRERTGCWHRSRPFSHSLGQKQLPLRGAVPTRPRRRAPGYPESLKGQQSAFRA
jgi:hypothetical protein